MAAHDALRPWAGTARDAAQLELAMQYFIVRTDAAGSAEVRLEADDSPAQGMTRGDRVVFYHLRGEGESARAVFVAWGEVERLSTDGEGGVAHLHDVTPLKRRVPFADLRSDPRRGRTAAVQPVPAEVFNQVLAHSRK